MAPFSQKLTLLPSEMRFIVYDITETYITVGCFYYQMYHMLPYTLGIQIQGGINKRGVQILKN